MQHSIHFDGGRLVFKLLPTKVLFEIQDVTGGKADTADLDGAATGKLVGILDNYVDKVEVSANGFASEHTTIAETPLPWGMLALEAMLDFSFGAATTDGKPSES